MNSLASVIPFDLDGNQGVSLLGLPAKKTARRTLPGSAEGVLRNIASILEEIITKALRSRTVAEFEATFEESFPDYVKLVTSFGRIASTVVSRPAMLRLAAESFAELESDVREHGKETFGESMKERALFTVWTLRKTSDLLESIAKLHPEAQSEKDRDLLGNYLFHGLRARFHLDCLLIAMHKGPAPYPDVLPAIDDGLRSAVNAYACVKQSLDLRQPSNDDSEPPFNVPWTSEEDALLADSMRGVAE